MKKSKQEHWTACTKFDLPAFAAPHHKEANHTLLSQILQSRESSSNAVGASGARAVISCQNRRRSMELSCDLPISTARAIPPIDNYVYDPDRQISPFVSWFLWLFYVCTVLHQGLRFDLEDWHYTSAQRNFLSLREPQFVFHLMKGVE